MKKLAKSASAVLVASALALAAGSTSAMAAEGFNADNVKGQSLSTPTVLI